MTIPPAAAANLEYAREALATILCSPMQGTGDAMVVEIARQLLDSLHNEKPTHAEIFLAVMLALAVERLRGQEGFAA